MIESGFDLVQFIKDFELITILFLFIFALAVRYEMIQRISSAVTKINELREALHEEHTEQKKEMKEQFDWIDQRQSEHYNRLWEQQKVDRHATNKNTERIVALEKDIEYITKRGG